MIIATLLDGSDPWPSESVTPGIDEHDKIGRHRDDHSWNRLLCLVLAISILVCTRSRSLSGVPQHLEIRTVTLSVALVKACAGDSFRTWPGLDEGEERIISVILCQRAAPLVGRCALRLRLLVLDRPIFVLAWFYPHPFFGIPCHCPDTHLNLTMCSYAYQYVPLAFAVVPSHPVPTPVPAFVPLSHPSKIRSLSNRRTFLKGRSRTHFAFNCSHS